MRLAHITVPLLAAVLLVTAGCGGSGGADRSDLPEATALLTEAGDAVAEVETVAMRLTAEPPLPDLSLHGVEGVLTRDGEAEGTASLEQLGQRVELKFVVVGDTFHYQLVGSWNQVPLSDAAVVYDPSAVLDPDRGLAQLLRTATDAETVDSGDGRYEISATFSPDALAELLPGPVAAQPTGTVWIGADDQLPHRAEFPVEPEGTLTVELSDFDAPTQIRAP